MDFLYCKEKFSVYLKIFFVSSVSTAILKPLYDPGAHFSLEIHRYFSHKVIWPLSANFAVSVFELNNFKQICLPRTLFFMEQTMKKHLTGGEMMNTFNLTNY